MDVLYMNKVAFNHLFSCCCLQKTATAVAHCKRGNGLLKINGCPLHLVEPSTLRYKVQTVPNNLILVWVQFSLRVEYFGHS